MAKLMPMSDSGMWIEYGNQLDADDVFASETIQMVLPLDGTGALVADVRRDVPEVIERIRIVFESGMMQEYPVEYQKTTGGLAASYGIAGTNLRYQFRRYVSAADETVLQDTVAKAAGYDYASEIAGLTPEEESRLYADYYQESVKGDMERVLRSFFASGGYPTYSSHPAVRALAEERMREDETLKRMLYAYNYYEKWYRINYRGIMLSELLFFPRGPAE